VVVNCSVHTQCISKRDGEGRGGVWRSVKKVKNDSLVPRHSASDHS
jgi:hypothetical protein